MCHFITATIPASSSVNRLNELAHKHGLKFSVIHNPFVEWQLPSDSIYLAKESPQCDCGTVIGILCSSNVAQDDHAQIGKLKKKGWSQAKIERWLSEKKGAQDKLERERAGQKEQRYQEAADWLAFLQAATEDKNVGQLGLLLHFYRTNLETERVQIKSTQTVSPRDIAPLYLMEIEEDILYVFTQ